jgi:hypothetical protein
MNNTIFVRKRTILHPTPPRLYQQSERDVFKGLILLIAQVNFQRSAVQTGFPVEGTVNLVIFALESKSF